MNIETNIQTKTLNPSTKETGCSLIEDGTFELGI